MAEGDLHLTTICSINSERATPPAHTHTRRHPVWIKYVKQLEETQNTAGETNKMASVI